MLQDATRTSRSIPLAFYLPGGRRGAPRPLDVARQALLDYARARGDDRRPAPPRAVADAPRRPVAAGERAGGRRRPSSAAPSTTAPPTCRASRARRGRAAARRRTVDAARATIAKALEKDPSNRAALDARGRTDHPAASNRYVAQRHHVLSLTPAAVLGTGCQFTSSTGARIHDVQVPISLLFGSIRSRSPSPRKLKPSTSIAIARPGKIVRCGASNRCDAPGVEHRPPARRRRLDAEAEEAERRLGDDRARHAERRLDDDRGKRRRQHVAQDDPRGAGAEGARRLHELELARAQRLAAHQARVAHPADHATARGRRSSGSARARRRARSPAGSRETPSARRSPG